MATIRKFAYIVVAIFLVLVAVLFAYGNPDPITIDIGIARLQNVPMTVAFVCVFALGWAFGLACAAFALLRMTRERQRLRRDLRFAETELSTLRALPLHDAH